MSTLTVPATLDSLAAIGRFIMEAAAEAGLSNAAAYKLRLAVDEIATNAINYGSAGSRGPGTFLFRAETDAQTMTLTQEDYGAPYDPRTRPAPAGMDQPLEEREIGGLGVYLALTGVDRFDYQFDGERNRNIFVMNRPQAAGA